MFAAEQQGEMVCCLHTRIAAWSQQCLGGHIKPDAYRGFLDYKAMHGSDVARQQCTFELANVYELSKFIREQGLAEAVDLVETRSFDAFMAKGGLQKAKASYSAFKEAGGDVSQIHFHDEDTAAEVLPSCQVQRNSSAKLILEENSS